MANNLRKFTDNAAYSAATLMKPAVSLIASTNEVKFDQVEPAPTYLPLNGYDIAVRYNILDASNEVLLYNATYEGDESYMYITQMEVDGVVVTTANTYRFSTTGEHIVRYKLGETSFGYYIIPLCFRYDVEDYTEVTVGDVVTNIGEDCFQESLNNDLIVTLTNPSLPTIANNSFGYHGNAVEKIQVPCGTNNPTIKNAAANSKWGYIRDNNKIAAIQGTEHDCD